ncbi:MAG: hypothetical protein LBL83_10575 [Clostridiales bacterium]|nr:hypothetical protein [Clostridiales bacterium]
MFGFALHSVSSAYFLAELAIGAIFILISPDGYKAALLVQICAAGLYGLALIPNMLANEHTAGAEEKRSYQIDYVKKASAELKSLLDSVGDKGAKKKVEAVYDALYSSPVRSHPGLAQAEAQILMSISDLGGAVAEGNAERAAALADSLLIAVGERNRQLKMLN